MYDGTERMVIAAEIDLYLLQSMEGPRLNPTPHDMSGQYHDLHGMVDTASVLAARG